MGVEVAVADGFLARLAGLALVPAGRAGAGLLIRRCASVHTFGMRFAIDVVFLGCDGEILGVRRAVAPGRIVSHRGATAVLELPSKGGEAAEPTA